MDAHAMNSASRQSGITGFVLTTLIALFLLFDGVMKLVQPKFVTEATARIGFPFQALTPIGITLIVATLLYVAPATSVLGALLLTGYLGGAVATQVHARSSAFETMFPVIFGVLIWISMLLRESRLRELLPIGRRSRRSG
jgi:hypothetical protein